MTIVACVDRSDHVAEIIVEAARLGEAFDEPIHAVHVLTRDKFVGLQRTSVSDTGQAVSVEEIEEIAAEIAAEALEEAGVDGEAVGLVGKPAEEIMSYADSIDTRYIVLGGRNRSLIGKALFGSVAQSILLDSDYPSVIVHSEE